MSRVLRLLHPFAPFVTEELWCHLGCGTGTIQLEPWPDFSPRPPDKSNRAADLYAAADAGRKLRGEVKLPSNQKVPFTLVLNNLVAKTKPLTSEQTSVLAAFLNASELHLASHPPEPAGPKAFTPLGELYLPAFGLVDPAVERDRLNKDLLKTQKDLEQTRRKLGDSAMLAKAPAEKIEQWRELEKTLVEKETSSSRQPGEALIRRILPTCMAATIEVSQLTKVYRTYQKEPGFLGALKGLAHRRYKETAAAQGVNLTVQEGELVGFLGPNGAGKTTVLKMLSGLLYPTSGQATVLGFVPWRRQNNFKRAVRPRPGSEKSAVVGFTGLRVPGAQSRHLRAGGEIGPANDR